MSEGDIVEVLEKHPNTWLTTSTIFSFLPLTSTTSMTRSLRNLRRYGMVHSKQVFHGRYQYMYKENEV